MKKFILFIVFVTGSFVLPFYYHTDIYRFYLKFYFAYRYPGGQYMYRARKFYDDGNYAELVKFSEPLLYVYMDNNELKRLTGMGMIRLGDERKGAEMYTSGMESGKYNEFEAAKVIKILYYADAYDDVLYYYGMGILMNHIDISYYYGVSLLRIGRVDEAYDMFMRAKRGGYSDTQMLYYHTGLALEKKKRFSEAADYLLRAYRTGPADDELVNALVRVYGSLGMYDRAGALLRSKKK